MNEDWIAKWADLLPERPAISETKSKSSVTYSELNRMANNLFYFFSEKLHLGKGHRIAMITENCIENIALFSFAQKSGCILVPLNYRLSAYEIGELLIDSNPHMVIYEEKFSHLISEFDFDKNPVHLMKLSELGKAARKGQSPVQAQREDLCEKDPIFILYTSGSTAQPKGVLYTRKMLFWNSINTALAIGLSTDSSALMCMPPFHTGGWNVLTTPVLHHGGCVQLVKKFEPSLILEAIEKDRPNVFMAVPTMLKLLAENTRFEQTDMSSLSNLIVGGEPMPIPLIELWHQKGVRVRQGYGMTEVGPNLTSLHHDYAIRKKGSIGKTNFYLDHRIVNGNREDVKPGEVGELLLKGPVVTPGYWNNEAASRQAFKDGWFCTGDLAREDEEGFLYITDRIKNMFISGGENVYPAEIERVILMLDQVTECVVVSRPDPRWGESGIAFVVLKPNHPPDEHFILNHCKSRLAGFKLPRQILFLENLPITGSGKIDRAALKKLACD